MKGQLVAFSVLEDGPLEAVGHHVANVDGEHHQAFVDVARVGGQVPFDLEVILLLFIFLEILKKYCLDMGHCTTFKDGRHLIPHHVLSTLDSIYSSFSFTVLNVNKNMWTVQKCIHMEHSTNGKHFLRIG